MQQGVNGVNGVNNIGITPPQPSPSREGVLVNPLQGAVGQQLNEVGQVPPDNNLNPLPQGEGNNENPENQLSNDLLQNLPPQDLLPQNLPPQPNTDVILGLIKLISQVSQGKEKNTSELEALINSMEELLEDR